MERTSFAGIAKLDPNDPLSTEGYQFQHEDREVIDHFLQVGAQTHRHDEHPALADPAAPPVLAITPSGGAIGADLEITVAYTLIDAYGGETAPSSAAVVQTPPGLAAPGSAMAASANPSSGMLLAGYYYYAATVTDGQGGETALSDEARVYVDPGYASGQIHLSGLSGLVGLASGVLWRLWRRVEGGPWGLLAQGTADSYIDDGTVAADATLSPPRFTGTTRATSQLHVTVPSGLPSAAQQFRIYAGIEGEEFSNPSRLGTYPLADQGSLKTYPSLDLQDGRPPSQSRSVQGARKIDPDTELVDWHWRRPVNSSAALPSGAAGDVRYVMDENRPYGVPSGAGATGPGGWAALGGMAVVRSGGQPVLNVRVLEFVGSGGTGVEVTPLGGGSARMTVAASGSSGGGSSNQGSDDPRIMAPIVMGGFPRFITTFAPGANAMRLVRCVALKTGDLRHLTYAVATQAGNVILAVYDTGDLSAGNYSRLYQSGAVAVGGVGFQTIDPGVGACPVILGKHYLLAIIFSSATAAYVVDSTLNSTLWGQLPSQFLSVPGGAAAKTVGAHAPGSHTAPATISEAGVAANDRAPALFGLIV